MKKFIKSKLALQIVLTSFIAVLIIAGVVYAATTIGDDISTGGTLSVSGDLTVHTNDFAVDADGGITMVPTSGEFGITGSTTISADLAVDTDTLFVDSSTDRVGISSSTPTDDLSIGTAGATSTIFMGYFCMYAEDEAGEGFYITISPTGASGNVFATSTTPCNQ